MYRRWIDAVVTLGIGDLSCHFGQIPDQGGFGLSFHPVVDESDHGPAKFPFFLVVAPGFETGEFPIRLALDSGRCVEGKTDACSASSF